MLSKDDYVVNTPLLSPSEAIRRNVECEGIVMQLLRLRCGDVNYLDESMGKRVNWLSHDPQDEKILKSSQQTFYAECSLSTKYVFLLDR